MAAEARQRHLRSTPPASSAAAPANSTPAEAPSTDAADNAGNAGSADLESLIGSAAMGVTDTGETIYFAEAIDSSFAILLFYNEDTNESASFVGPISANGTFITVEDSENGLTFTFEMLESEDDLIIIDIGEFGQAVMGECSAADIVEAIEAIGAYSNAVA